MGAISKESIRWSAAQLATKQLHVEPTDAAPVNPVALFSRPSSASTPSSLSQVPVSLADIME